MPFGDVNHRPLLTHQGKYQSRIAGQAIIDQAAGRPLNTSPWGPHVTSADSTAVLQVIFTTPEAAAFGRTAEQAAAEGFRIRVVDVDLGQTVIGANLYADGYQGRARMIADEDAECLLGVTFVGPGVSELLHSATVAVAAQVRIDRLWHAVPCFPTISEAWLRSLVAYRG
jgi:pyruvate/2-oxoglutarate dehydrogenase complex dihydrolipoamide dehydrogenase (E3) component